jgi:hypothetical protein
MIVPEQLNIGLEGMNVWKWRQEIRELSGIIPYTDVISQFSPGHQVIRKILAFFPDGNTTVAFYGAQDDEHIFPGYDMFRGFSGILVGEG